MDTKFRFDIPIVLFMFQRAEKTLQVLEQIKKIKPTKLYLLSDNGRTNEEKDRVYQCRALIESSIDWECEVIKNYATTNIGVHANIGLGAMWVLDREKWAIFLEDDNLPELTFFYYCREMLYRYEDNPKIFWICGTNYLEEYKPEKGESYLFTQLLLPCGWASWGKKFNQYYDYNLTLASDTNLKSLISKYNSSIQYYNYITGIYRERDRLHKKIRFSSWDYHLELTIKTHDLFGIVPMRNQIKNIGVDEFSTHGGTTLKNPNTDLYTSMKSLPMNFPLIHPNEVRINRKFEIKMDRYLIKRNVKTFIRMLNLILKKILKIYPHESTFSFFRKYKGD